MATYDVLLLNTVVGKAQVAQATDDYNFPRPVNMVDTLTVAGLINGRNVAADGALAQSAVQPGANVSVLANDAGYQPNAALADQSEAEAGTENTKTMTALRTKQAIDALSPASIKNNFAAISDPTSTNDDSEGYAIGSRWTNTVDNKTFECVDATANTAVWVQTNVQTVSGVVAYGSLLIQANSTAEVAVDATPRKLAAWNADGLASGCSVDHTIDRITVSAAGNYIVTASVSFSGTGSKNYILELYKNGAATGIRAERMLGTGGDVGSCTFLGIVAMAEDDYFELYQHSTDGGTSMLVTEGQISTNRAPS